VARIHPLAKRIAELEQLVESLRTDLAQALTMTEGERDTINHPRMVAYLMIAEGMPETFTPDDVADEVERLRERNALLERLFAAVEKSYGPTDAADCEEVEDDLERLVALPDEALDLAEALVEEIGPEPVQWLSRRFNTVPALRGARTAREVARVLAMC
jgi:hypothetical protein